MQKVRLRQAPRYREALRAVQGKSPAILERLQESRRSSRRRVAGGYCWREDEEEVREHFVDDGKMILSNISIFKSSYYKTTESTMATSEHTMLTTASFVLKFLDSGIWAILFSRLSTFSI